MPLKYQTYFFVILIIIPVSFIVLVPHDFENFSKSLIASATFLANVYFFRNGNYFDVNLQNQPLLHLWSISIEAQFYLLVPILFILLIYYYFTYLLLFGYCSNVILLLKQKAPKVGSLLVILFLYFVVLLY